MSEYDHEPIRGLPGMLPPGETIVWQGSPEWRTLARSALHTRWIGGYFALLAVLALASGSAIGAALSVAGGVFTVALLAAFAWAAARTTVYTLTNRRVVLRIGVALQTCINLPFSALGGADLALLGRGYGDIALAPSAAHRLGYAILWPHARPWRLRNPQPMLRSIPEAAEVARLLAQLCKAPVAAPIVVAEPLPALHEAAAA